MVKIKSGIPCLWLLFLLLHLYPAASLANWWDDRTFYQIFTRSFQDSDGDGAGDLNGIRSRLDYLNNGEANTQPTPKSLGIGGIWLTPIFPSPSYHGYDATDFLSVEPNFGTLEDLRALLRDAHRRGIKVVLDIAINFTSDRHPWFQDASASPTSKSRDWFLWRDNAPAWGKWYRLGNHYYYSVFDRSMPHLNWRNPKVAKAFKGILSFWMKQGVDGFRMDAARYYIPGPNGEADTAETHRVLADLANAVRSEYPQALFVGEIWADAPTIHSYLSSGRELDLAFNFPLAFSLVPTLNTEDVSSFAWALNEFKNIFKKPQSSAPFLTNHDMDRLANVLWHYDPKIRLAAEINFMLPGTPFLYYGEEIGLANGKGQGDLAKRVPMQWDDTPGFGFTPEGTEPWQPFLGTPEKYSVAAHENRPGSLLHLYRKLIHLRNRSPVLSRGTLDSIQTGGGSGIVYWLRRYERRTALVVVNFSHKPSAPFSPAPALGNVSHIASVLYGGPVLSKQGRGRLEVPALPPHSAHAFLLE